MYEMFGDGCGGVWALGYVFGPVVNVLVSEDKCSMIDEYINCQW